MSDEERGIEKVENERGRKETVINTTYCIDHRLLFESSFSIYQRIAVNDE